MQNAIHKRKQMKSPGNGGSVVKDRETQAVPTDLENTS